MVKITVKNDGVKFRAEGLAQAFHFALASEGKTVVIINRGDVKDVLKYQDGKRVESRTIPVS